MTVRFGPGLHIVFRLGSFVLSKKDSVLLPTAIRLSSSRTRASSTPVFENRWQRCHDDETRTMTVSTSRRRAIWREIPVGIWALGFVSLLMDISSEMIHALLPVYMVTVLGTSALTVGMMEGVAEATASITKVFSGALSDWLGKRKLLAAIGYGLAAFTKPIFSLAPSISWLVAARFIDRIGKGIRG